MIISHKHQFIFLANAKTGTSSMYSVLEQFNETKFKQHKTLGAGFNSVNLDFDFSNYFIFCFVRNPWDRTISRYYQQQKPINLHHPWRKYLHRLAHKYSPRDFLKKVDESFFKRGAQSNYYLLEGNLINFVGRFENLQEEFYVACDKIGIPRQQLPHKNKGKHKHYTEYYDGKTEQIVAEKHAKDIEHFGYKFGE